MVSVFERARQRISLFFEPAVKTTREIVSQIPGVDVERPISPVPEAPGFKPAPRPSGRGAAPSAPTPTAPRVTIGETEAQKQSRLRQEAEARANQERIRKEAEKQRQATIEFQSRQIFDTSTFTGRLKEQLIAQDPLLGRLARRVKTFEERKFEEGKGVVPIIEAREKRTEDERLAFENRYERDKLPNETKLQFVRRTKPRWWRGGSITQRYFELWGIEFYAPKERTLIIEQKVKEIAPKYSGQYQDAFNRRYQNAIETGQISFENAVKQFESSAEAKNISSSFSREVLASAPTSRLGNVLVGLTDMYFKFSLFAPYLRTGITQRQQLELYKKSLKKPTSKTEAIEKAKDVVRKIESKFKTSGKTGVQSEVKKVLSQLKTPQSRQAFQNVLQDLHNKGLINDFILNAETGQITFLAEGVTAPIGVPPSVLLPPVELKALPEIAGGLGVAKTRFDKLNLKKQQELIKQASEPLGLTKLADKQKDRQVLTTAQFDKQVQRFAQEQKNKLKQLEKQIQVSALAQPQLQVPKQLQITEQMLRQPQIPRQPTRPRQPIKPIPKLPSVPLITLERLRKPITPPTPQGYNVFGKQIKTQKFMKLNKVPLSKTNAENLGSYLIDNSLARTFKYKLAGKPAQKSKLDIPQNYFRNQRYKFRDFRIVKGVRKPMKDKLIENKFHLLDTRAEVSDIHLRKALADLERRSSARRKSVKKLKRGRKRIVTLKDLQKRQPQKQIKSEDLFAPIEFPQVF